MKKYSEEFKQESVKLALQSDQSYSKTAKELGIKANTLYNWISKSQTLTTSKEDMETIALHKENKRLKQELEILKKAAAYFAKSLK